MQKFRKNLFPQNPTFLAAAGHTKSRVMQMKYEDPNMEAYWNTLSPQVQARIEETGIALCSLGMLRKLGDYYQNSREGQVPGG